MGGAAADPGGVRAGISLALVIVVVAETFIGSIDRLGHCVINTLNPLFLLIEKPFAHWAGQQRLLHIGVEAA